MDEKGTDRLEAFSDGVFAVAITLLVLDIKFTPSAERLSSDADIWNTIRLQIPLLVAFVNSFFTIGITWLNHHRLFRLIQRADTPLLLLNLLLLLFIVFIPVPTALLAPYVFRNEYHAAAILYAGTFLLMATSFNILWRYASYHNRLLNDQLDQQAIQAVHRQFLFGPLCYIIAFVLAWINTPVSVIFQLLLALFYAFPAHLLLPRQSNEKARNELEQNVD